MSTLQDLQEYYSALMGKYNRLNKQEAESPAGKMLAQNIKGISRQMDVLLNADRESIFKSNYRKKRSITDGKRKNTIQKR